MSAVSTGMRRFHPAPQASTRLFCFAHAGGSATFFASLAQRLVPTVEVLAFQYPGRQERFGEPCVESISELADLAVAEVREWLDRPFGLFGHSMGATLAFEVARRLEGEGQVARGLFASGRRAPSVAQEGLLHLADDEILVADVLALGGTDPRVLRDRDLRSLVLPAIRSDYKAVETYRYAAGRPLTCPILALTGDRDAKVPRRHAKAWAAHTAGPFELREFAGGHFFLDEHADSVTDCVTAYLGNGAGAGTGSGHHAH